MSRLVKIVNNKYVQIEEYRNPNICFNTNEYNDFEDYCTLRETFDPFEIFYENKELKDNWNKLKEIIKKKFVAQGGFISYEWNDLLNELLDKMQELERGVSDDNN